VSSELDQHRRPNNTYDEKDEDDNIIFYNGPNPGVLDMHFVPGLRDYLRYVEHVPSDQEITRSTGGTNNCSN
jgi:hypothetical protein